MKGRVVGFLGVAVAVGIAGCKSSTDVPAFDALDLARNTPKFSCLANSATMPLPADLRATLPNFGPRTPDDAFVSISQSVPGGFAGIFFTDNHFVLTFVDPAAAQQSRNQIIQALIAANIGGAAIDAPSTEFRGARWTFAELDEWYRYILPKLGTPESPITSSDIDEKANTIAFGVIDETARALLESKLKSLNVSCNLVTTHIQAPAIAV